MTDLLDDGYSEHAQGRVRMRSRLIRSLGQSPILIGAVLLYAACAAIPFFTSATDWASRIFVGAFWGSLLWILLVAPHAGIQMLIRWQVSTRLPTSGTWAVFWWMNTVTILLALGAILAGLSASTPRAYFERFVMKPVPESVASMEARGRRGITTGETWTFHFEISPPDSQALIQHCRLNSDGVVVGTNWHTVFTHRFGTTLEQGSVWRRYSRSGESDEAKFYYNESSQAGYYFWSRQ